MHHLRDFATACVLTGSFACASGDTDLEPAPSSSAATASPTTAGGEVGASAPPPEPEPPPDPEQMREPVLVMVEGPDGTPVERYFEASVARDSGYAIIDFSDDWTPYLFEPQYDERGQLLPNRYRRVLVGLSNDELNGDGLPLQDGEVNYLELYGIFPSFSVLRRRFLQDENRLCVTPEGQAALGARESVRFRSASQTRRDDKRRTQAKRELDRALADAEVASLDELVTKRPQLESKVKAYQRLAAERAALTAAEERLACEGLLDLSEPKTKKERRKAHSRGFHDEALRVSLRRFQQKHMIYEGHSLRPRTLDALERSTLEGDHASLMRALRERVVAAAGILEDGSTHGSQGAPEYRARSGDTQPQRNLADEFRDVAAQQLGLHTTEGALAFFQRHDESEFESMRVGVKLPPLPEYYDEHMDLEIVVDRGDVWYDPPFDDEGNWVTKGRSRYPKLSLVLNYGGQQLPLVRWRTTIGGWRSEQAGNGYEYYKYKGSDVGSRVMRKIISGPVWIAPESTPIRSLVTSKRVGGAWQAAVNYDELGPGYESAYGLVAGYFVIPGKGDSPDVDRGIRAHGSSNYLSIYSSRGYSHGCHRLPNHLAIRLYDFLLKHRRKIAKGDAAMDFTRQFLSGERVYEMRIPSRGFEFELDPPVPVTVLTGRVRGEARKPIEGYVPKPGVRYPEPASDESEEGTESEAESDPLAEPASSDAVSGASRRWAPPAGARP